MFYIIVLIVSYSTSTFIYLNKYTRFQGCVKPSLSHCPFLESDKGGRESFRNFEMIRTVESSFLWVM